jgi:hypothetical protein
MLSLLPASCCLEDVAVMYTLREETLARVPKILPKVVLQAMMTIALYMG